MADQRSEEVIYKLVQGGTLAFGCLAMIGGAAIVVGSDGGLAKLADFFSAAALLFSVLLVTKRPKTA